jgi:hypothetical protein
MRSLTDPEGGRMFIEIPKILFFDPEGVVREIPIHAPALGGISESAITINI